MAAATCVLRVEGLDCPVEAGVLRTALSDLSGVENLEFDYGRSRMRVDFQPGSTSPLAIQARITTRTGMRAVLLDETTEQTEIRTDSRSLHRLIATLVSGSSLAAGLILQQLSGTEVFQRACFAVAIAAGGVELLPRALSGLRRFRLDIYLLMLLAVAGAIGLRLWDEAATVAFLFGLSERLEAWGARRAQAAVRSLLALTPDLSEIIDETGETRIVPAKSVQVGARVLVRPGARIPVDGMIVAGHSHIDEKAITGESVPVSRGPGDQVFAGTINDDGIIEITADRTLENSSVSRMLDLVRAAQLRRAPVQRRIERFAAYYTPLVILLAIILALAWPPIEWWMSGEAGSIHWLAGASRALVVLVIACPCALVISTPIAVACGLAAAARHGVLIKGGDALEELGRLRVLAFDKTGTLTRGEPDVVEVVPAETGQDDGLLRIAAALGDRGGHILGRAIARYARGRQLSLPRVECYRAVPGMGATGTIESVEYHIGSHRFLDENGLCPNESDFHTRLSAAERSVGTSVALSNANGPLGWIRLADSPRGEAVGVIAELESLGVRTVMLTGDNASTAAAIARQLGIADQRAGLLPEDKSAALAEIDAHHGAAGMVGDGVNDAPALASARLSIALGGAHNAPAIEAADIVLLSDELTTLPWLVRLSRATLGRIRQNIALALGIKLGVLALAALGIAGMWMAIASDLGASLIVTANALRLLYTSKT